MTGMLRNFHTILKRRKSPIRVSSFILLLTFSATILAGCSETLIGSYNPGTKPADQFKAEQVAGFYMLPRGLLRVQLKEKGGRFTINVAEPVYSGDPATAYTLHYSASPFASDTVEIEIDPATNLLKGVQLRAEDKLDDIIVEAARAVVIVLESAKAAPEEVILVDRMIDPSKPEEVLELKMHMNEAAKSFARKRSAAECGPAFKKPKPDEEALRLQACKSYEQMMSDTPIDFGVTPPVSAASSLAIIIPADACQKGICIRPTLPYTVSIRRGPPCQGEA